MNDDWKNERSEVLVEIRPAQKIAVLTLNRPQLRNAFNASLMVALSYTVARLDADPDIRAIVLTGAGKVFCAGMDLGEFANGEGEKAVFDSGLPEFTRQMRKTPIIAAVRGAALAGGFEIMLACDLVVAAQDAIFGLPEVRVGLIAGAGGVAHLPNRIPVALAREILLLGAPVDAKRAFETGLINRIVDADDVLPNAIVMAQQIAANAPLAVAATMGIIHQAMSGGAGALNTLNDELLRDIMRSDDAKEGATAFKDRRTPNWTGA